MVQIIEENKKPTFSRMFGQAFANLGQTVGKGASQYLQGKQAQQEQKKREAQLTQLTGMDAPPEFQEAIFKNMLQQKLQEQKYGFESKLADEAGQRKLKESADKLRGEEEPLRGALDVVDRMRAIRKKGNLGVGTSFSPFPETRQQAGEYEQLGKSLIQYASNIPIRNQIEFQTLAEELYDPSITDARAEGVLNAMERIINNSLQKFERQEGSSEKPSDKKNRPPLSSFQR
jgi:hypothetical protein